MDSPNSRHLKNGHKSTRLEKLDIQFQQTGKIEHTTTSDMKCRHTCYDVDGDGVAGVGVVTAGVAAGVGGRCVSHV